MSEEMLRHARWHVTELGLDNVDFLLGDITALHQFDSGSIDGVISTVSLHHPPTHEHLDKCFAEINRVLTPMLTRPQISQIYVNRLSIDLDRGIPLKSAAIVPRPDELEQTALLYPHMERQVRIRSGA